MSVKDGAGGTPGGVGGFFGGVFLFLLGGYFFLDSVYVTVGGYGMVCGFLYNQYGMGGAGFGQNSGMAVIFVPFLAGVGILFYDAAKKLGWILVLVGLLLIGVEIVSRLRFVMATKLTHLLLMMGLMAGGVGMVLRSLKSLD